MMLATFSPRKVLVNSFLVLLFHHHLLKSVGFVICSSPLKTSKPVHTTPESTTPLSLIQQCHRDETIQTSLRLQATNTHPYYFLNRKRNQSNGFQLKAVSVGSIGTSVLPLPDAIAASTANRGIGSYFLTRIVFLRGLAFVYFFAFLIALHQNRGLIGDNGITPGMSLLFISEGYIVHCVFI